MKKGQALVEYALILALVSIIAISALSILGKSLENTFEKVNSALSGNYDQSSNNGSNNGDCTDTHQNQNGNGHTKGNGNGHCK